MTTVDDFKQAHDAIEDHACGLICSGVGAVTVADALIEIGLALWAANGGNSTSAETVLREYVTQRDAANGH